MSSYWTNFVKSGDPNGKGPTKWPEYHLKEKQVMMLGDQAKAQPIPDSEALELIYSLIIKS
jgi:para-nitrobenzyl esterase